MISLTTRSRFKVSKTEKVATTDARHPSIGSGIDGLSVNDAIVGAPQSFGAEAVAAERPIARSESDFFKWTRW